MNEREAFNIGPAVARDSGADYGNLASWVDTAETNAKKGLSAKNKNDKWAGGSWDDACSAMRGGVDESKMKLVQGLFTQFVNLLPPAESVLTEMDVEGAFPDVGMFIAGEPECMVRFTQENADQRRLTLYVNTVTSWMVDEKLIFTRGAVLCAMVEFLERMGVQCKVVAMCCMRWQNEEGINVDRVLVKDFGDFLSLRRLLPVFYPYFLRRIAFGVWEGYPEAEQIGATQYGGYGHVNITMKDVGILETDECVVMESSWKEAYDIPTVVEQVLSKVGMHETERKDIIRKFQEWAKGQGNAG